jgi:hypothetical protein
MWTGQVIAPNEDLPDCLSFLRSRLTVMQEVISLSTKTIERSFTTFEELLEVAVAPGPVTAFSTLLTITAIGGLTKRSRSRGLQWKRVSPNSGHAMSRTSHRLSATRSAPSGAVSSPGMSSPRRLLAHQRFLNLSVTNVPGPPVPLYLAGARLLELFPVVAIMGNVTLGVGVLSYAGQLNFTAVADRDTCPTWRCSPRACAAPWMSWRGQCWCLPPEQGVGNAPGSNTTARTSTATAPAAPAHQVVVPPPAERPGRSAHPSGRLLPLPELRERASMNR